MNEPIADTHELLKHIESKDRRFRIAQAVFFVAMLVGILLLLVLSYSQESKNNVELTEQTQSLAQQKAIINRLETGSIQRTNQITDLQKHIDCIFVLFGQSNRSNLTISNAQNCTLTPTGSSGSATTATKSG